MIRNRSPKSARGGDRQVARLEVEVEVDQLRHQVATAQAALQYVDQDSTGAQSPAGGQVEDRDGSTRRAGRWPTAS